MTTSDHPAPPRSRHEYVDIPAENIDGDIAAESADCCPLCREVAPCRWNALVDEVERLESKLAATRRVFARQNEALERMRPLCPDHRDKQSGKPCLACEVERLERENGRLRADFTGDLDQPPLEKIRAKCEQYWNEYVHLCPEEMHAILEFIHQLARKAAEQLATSERKRQEFGERVWRKGCYYGSGEGTYLRPAIEWREHMNRDLAAIEAEMEASDE